MELKKLEIKGFKSFGDKVVINFGEGITGIVGPNGCGKSNVVDAIRWVLGEQKTRTLRSDKMENIIFNGTRNRKPTQMAEVSLTFEITKNLLSTEYSTVTITRKYYRSGESEYMLNGVTCRLKDITNLFLDTGIASNSYAIIELKMVDDILNDKENARRGLFEEAAGISKFKIRKKETLRKLESTDADLDRVEDLLFEIDKNLRSLEKQAKQAERYYKLKEEYKQFSVELARISVADKNKVLQDLKSRIEGDNDRKIELNKKLSSTEALLQRAKAELVGKEKLLSERQKQLNDHVNKIRQYESDKQIKNERLNFLEDKSDNLKNQIDADKKSNDRAAFSMKSLGEELKDAAIELETISRKRDLLSEENQDQSQVTMALQEDLSRKNQEFRQKQDLVYNLQKGLEIKEIQLNSFRNELDRTSTDSSQHSQSLEEFDGKIKELNKEIEQRKKKIDAGKKREEDIRQALEDNAKTIETIRDQQIVTNRSLDAKKNEYNLTKSLIDNLEGFPEAIKFLKKKTDWGKNVPLLSDVIACDEKYRVTIENYLEPYMNYYIVDNQEQAYKAINLLSDAAKGKAYFFILDRIEQLHLKQPKIFDNATAASEIIDYDKKYQKLIAHILDNVYVVQSENEIPEDPDCTFITENGKFTSKKFSISGGSVGLFEGKRIGRAKNLEKLDNEIKELGKQLKEINKNLDNRLLENEKLRNSSQSDTLEGEQEGLNLLTQELISLQTKQEQYNALLSSQATRKEDIEQQITLLTKEVEEMHPQKLAEETSLTTLEADAAKLNEEYLIQSNLLKEKSAAYNEQNILYHQQQNKISRIEQEIDFKKSSLESSQERIERNQFEQKNTENEIRNLLEKSEIHQDELIGLYEQKDSLEEGVNEAEKEYYAARGEIDQHDKEIREIQRQRESADTLLMELQNQLNEARLDLTSIKERLSIEFNVDLEKLGTEPLPEDSGMSAPELREKVDKLNEKIERIGPINPMAMEAYEEIKERHDFIMTQKEDLEKAKESLLTTIDEIDQVAKETFLEAFDKIKENFITVFRSLFTDEDDCDLRLSDPENPLDSSVDIIAKPKGKKPLTINQLSGGEKTLTATSLLFAIYLLKPAPFCIFDEVDAPLDDANIDKFNNIIRKFSSDSQFVIVTHNKRTMEATDIIYGITMVEQGVSRVVPVDLRELV